MYKIVVESLHLQFQSCTLVQFLSIENPARVWSRIKQKENIRKILFKMILRHTLGIEGANGEEVSKIVFYPFLIMIPEGGWCLSRLSRRSGHQDDSFSILPSLRSCWIQYTTKKHTQDNGFGILGIYLPSALWSEHTCALDMLRIVVLLAFKNKT